MLSDAVAAFLSSVSERAFDQTLLAILRAQGFQRIHLVHGQREFGKDVIGQQAGEQWAWQAKAGDISQAGWRELVGQLDELRLSNLGHGGFDISLPRRPVLVTTGRLVGNAPDLFRDYNDRARGKGEPELELWDRETLVGLLSDNPDAVLRGSMDGRLLAALGSAGEGTATMASLEVFSRRWSSWEAERISGLGVVEAALLAEHLIEHGRIDLAAHLALCLVRGAWASGAAAAAADEAAQLFEGYATQLWEADAEVMLGEDFVSENGPAAWITYPVRCVRIAELVGLLALRWRADGHDRADEVSSWLAKFVAAQPGTAHPVGDAYAVSLIPAALTIAAQSPEVVRQLLSGATIWLCNAYERDQLGLASLGASPDEEVERLLGGPLEWVTRERHRDSLIATVLLDLAAALGYADPYADIYNDIQAVDIYPRVLRVAEGPDLFDRAGMENRLDPNVDFAEALADAAVIAPHHADSTGNGLVDADRSWDLLAISSALRDRHFYRALVALR